MKQLILAILAVSILSTTALAAPRETGRSTNRVIVTSDNAKVNPSALREMLLKGLKVTRDDQKEYVDYVITRVVKRTLPVSAVYASFKYARTRRPQYPFPYFIYSVETLAKRGRK